MQRWQNSWSLGLLGLVLSWTASALQPVQGAKVPKAIWIEKFGYDT